MTVAKKVCIILSCGLPGVCSILAFAVLSEDFRQKKQILLSPIRAALCVSACTMVPWLNVRRRSAITNHVKSWYFIGSIAALAVCIVVMAALRVDLQW